MFLQALLEMLLEVCFNSFFYFAKQGSFFRRKSSEISIRDNAILVIYGIFWSSLHKFQCLVCEWCCWKDLIVLHAICLFQLKSKLRMRRSLPNDYIAYLPVLLNFLRAPCSLFNTSASNSN